MGEDPVIQKDFNISYSRAKTYELCSWVYYCKYVLNLPQRKNVAGDRGSCVHVVFECLLNKRHKKHYDIILKTKDVESSRAIIRLVKKHMLFYKMDIVDTKGNNNFNLIKEMILVGLGYDFYCSKYELIGSEQEIKIETKSYRLKGFVDKLAYDKTTNELIILDYKSSQNNKEDFSTQAMAYILWGKRVKNCNAVARFLYLRHGDDILQEYRFTDDELTGFEEYIKLLYKQLRDFNLEKAKSHFAFDDGYPKEGEGFKGAVMCGRSKFKGQLKKNGEVMYACEYKHPLDYYVISEGKKFIKSCFDIDEVLEYIDRSKYQHDVLKWSFERKKYEGCPRFYYIAEEVY